MLEPLDRWEDNYKWLEHTGYADDLKQLSMQLFGVRCAVDAVNRKEDYELDCVKAMLDGIKSQIDDLAHGRSLIDTLPDHQGETGRGE